MLHSVAVFPPTALSLYLLTQNVPFCERRELKHLGNDVSLSIAPMQLSLIHLSFLFCRKVTQTFHLLPPQNTCNLGYLHEINI